MKRTTQLFAALLFVLGLSTRLQAQDKILIVVTNNKEVKATIAGKDTVVAGGYELSEVAEAFKVFDESGFKVDFMSPLGGPTYAEPEKKLKPVNKAFLDRAENVTKLKNTLAPGDVKPEEYRAIYFAGGKTMWDFPNSKALAHLTAAIYEQNGTVGAVCHGPAALVNVKLSDGSSLIAGKKISSFTNTEEQLFGKTAKTLPFMLQDKLSSVGAVFQEMPAMLEQAVVDERLVTGQNPISTYSVAEEMVRLLGKNPPQRTWDDLSYTLAVVKTIILEDRQAAHAFMQNHQQQNELDERLLLEYSIYGSKGYFGPQVQNKGIALLEFVTEKYPENAKAHETLAEAYHKAGKTAQAKAAIDKSLALAPDSESAQKLKKEIEE